MPYWRLSGFYFFYFASLGALIPYWSLYLKSLGYDATAIGTLMAILMATKIVAPNIWAWIADHTGKRMFIVRVGCLSAALIFLGVFFSHDYWWLVVVMLLFSFFWNAALPQFEVTTFIYLGDHSHRYTAIRLWGSVGFIVTALALGGVLQGTHIGLLPWILFALFTGIWMTSMLVPEGEVVQQSLQSESLRNILKRPEILGLLTTCFLVQASHGPYYIFYTLYMEAHHYTLGMIGLLWAVGVIAEVIVFMSLHRLIPRIGLRRLLLLSLWLTIARWAMIGLFPQYLPLMFFAQCLHAASFGIYHASAIQLINKYFTGRHQGKGQALYSSLSFGAGGAIGSLYAGYIWDNIGMAEIFYVATGISFLALIVAWRYVGEYQE